MPSRDARDALPPVLVRSAGAKGKKPDPKKPDAKAAAKPGDKKGGKTAAEAAPVGLQLDSVFVLQPSSLDLRIDETAELTVFGFPVADGLVEDTIIARCAGAAECMGLCRTDARRGCAAHGWVPSQPRHARLCAMAHRAPASPLYQQRI